MMNDEADKPANQIGVEKNSRHGRLKLALRENLKRRKSQSRGLGGLVISRTDGGSSRDDEKAEPKEPKN